MPIIQKSVLAWSSKAFTLLESLLVLMVCSFLTLSLSGSVQTVLRDVEEEIFFLSFEHLYADSQRLAVRSHSSVSLQLTQEGISNGYQTVPIPKTIRVAPQTVVFDTAGGNSSLKKISFVGRTKQIHYQLYIGSGRYKKTKE